MRVLPAGVILAALSVVLAATSAGCAGTAPTASTSGPSASAVTITSPAERRDFLFQVNDYHTDNQGGQILDMYFHYRYNPGLPDTQLPNYEDLRAQALTFFAHIDSKSNPFWEVLNSQLCGQLHHNFPLQAISCQLLVHPDVRPGLPHEPGFHSSIDTIGDIEPHVVAVGPVSMAGP